MKEYRVLGQSDSFCKDRFSTTAVKDALNNFARSGWQVVAITSTEFNGLGGLGTNRNELIIVC